MRDTWFPRWSYPSSLMNPPFFLSTLPFQKCAIPQDKKDIEYLRNYPGTISDEQTASRHFFHTVNFKIEDVCLNFDMRGS